MSPVIENAWTVPRQCEKSPQSPKDAIVEVADMQSSPHAGLVICAADPTSYLLYRAAHHK